MIFFLSAKLKLEFLKPPEAGVWESGELSRALWPSCYMYYMIVNLS